MNCYYHDSNEATRSCKACNKSLCSECFHDQFTELCWTCGLNHQNELIVKESSLNLPKFTENRTVYYLLHKLFSAFASTAIFTCLLCMYFIVQGLTEIISVAYIIFLFTGTIVYTYGIFVSFCIDMISRIPGIRKWYFQGSLYLLSGLLLPVVSDMQTVFHKPINVMIGGVVALLFFATQHKKFQRELVVTTALISMVPMGVIMCFFLFVYIRG